ncbi:heterokaryon incompatibility protein domain-containing protein [Trichoderma barbatum]
MAIRFIEIIDIESNPVHLNLKECIEPRMPEYAILSHTWEHEEITYQEMMDISENPMHPATKKLGYQKIVETCRKAKKNGINYAWIDVCCIDKTNSSEISEAINSMYRWYQKAKICFAFLTDFRGAETSSEIGLPKCRWFTRGWCLQELIAPRNLEFFDADWTHIGSKIDMKCLISNITRIDEQVLCGKRPISSIPVARRMSWAAERVTTREEDIAYCLLGIFDVNMPMFYGEGRKAFMRLQEEIIKTSNDLSIFAFHNGSISGAQVYSDLFATSPKDFIGCGNLVDMGTTVNWDSAFSLTNKGLYFRRAKVQVNHQRGSYTMSLNCKLSKSRIAKMHLRKVGPGLFARYSSRNDGMDSREDEGNYTCFSMEIEEAYIITRVSPMVQFQLDNAEENVIHICSSKHNISRVLQVIQSANSNNRWDPARMQFLTAGDRFSTGYWKLFPSFSQPLTEAEYSRETSSSHCYLACGVEDTDYSNPRAWVRLCSLEEWRDSEATLGIVAQPHDMPSPLRTDCTADRITLYKGLTKPITVTTIVIPKVKGGKPYFELDLDFTGTPEVTEMPTSGNTAKTTVFFPTMERLFSELPVEIATTYTGAIEALHKSSEPSSRPQRRSLRNPFLRKRQAESGKLLESHINGDSRHVTEGYMTPSTEGADQEVESEGLRSLTPVILTEERKHAGNSEKRVKGLGTGCIPWPLICGSQSKRE